WCEQQSLMAAITAMAQLAGTRRLRDLDASAAEDEDAQLPVPKRTRCNDIAKVESGAGARVTAPVGTVKGSLHQTQCYTQNSTDARQTQYAASGSAALPACTTALLGYLDTSSYAAVRALLHGRLVATLGEQHAAGVADLILWRYHHEGWTSRDLECALYQTTLLGPTIASSIARPRNYLLNTPWSIARPRNYLLNTPWSDWTPPSQSEARFDSAHANRSARRPDRIAQRVSVHVCATPDPAGHGIVAFATVESCNASRHLILRRGVDILLNIPVDRLDVSLQSGPSDESGVVLLAHRSKCSTRPSEPHPRVFIKFVKDAGNQRLIKFLCMICVGLPPLV
ncbi:MAG: hypothetical protein ACPIOQ_35280, partial [Promethearchaeia archaeon]